MSDFYPNSYQTPNALIDQLLSSGDIDTYEFTLLSVIIRQTRGWHKLEDSISISQFEKLAPVISRRTIINKLQSLKEKGLIEVKEVVFGKENAPNKYKLSSAFSAKGGSAADAQGSAADAQGSAADAQGSAADAPIGSAADAQGGSAADAPTKNRSLNSVNSKQQNSPDVAVVSGDESPGAAIAAMKNNGIEAAKAAELVTLHGPARCLSEVDKAKFAAQKGAIRESVAAWIIGSLATPNGFSPPKGYQPPAERLAAEVAAAKRAEIARKKREAEEAAEQLRREQFEQLLAIYNDFPESEQRKIAERVINDFANKGEFQKFRIESWRKDGSSNFLIFKYRKVMFRDEFISVMLENEQEKAG